MAEHHTSGHRGPDFRLGTALITIVDPHPGREHEYDAWYERDHFYAGMMAGPHVFAGRRWVGPARVRDLPGALERARFAATYWIEEGHHDDFLGWAVTAVERLSSEGRMFEARDHVHTGFYELVTTVGDIPVEVCLDHPFPGMVVLLGGDAPEDLPQVATFHPLPTPGFDVPAEPLHVAFFHADPEREWPAVRPSHTGALWAAGFVPTVPGSSVHLRGL